MAEADSPPAAATDDDQVLLERLAKREERRQKRMKEAMERQKENDVAETNGTDDSLQPTDKEEEEQPAGKEEADANSCRTADEDKEGEKVRKMSFPIMTVLFEAGAHLYFIFHLQESAGESKTSTTAQVHLLFQLFCSFINKHRNSALS